MLTARRSPTAIEHAVPAYVPAARGPITHDVICRYPCRPEEEPYVEAVPCCGSLEVDAVCAAKRTIGVTDIRIVRRGGEA